MDDLTAFITARLDEDEDLARDLLSAHPGPWRVDLPSDVRDSAGKVVVADEYHWSPMPHIARHDPARALREVAAKRCTLERHRNCGHGIGYCDDGGHGWYDDAGGALCNDKLDVAAAWADHHDYRPEWAIGVPS